MYQGSRVHNMALVFRMLGVLQKSENQTYVKIVTFKHIFHFCSKFMKVSIEPKVGNVSKDRKFFFHFCELFYGPTSLTFTWCFA
jgi:hypothetical protein